MANELRYRATIKDDVSGPLERLKDKFGQLKKQGAKPLFEGMAMGAGIAAFDALKTGVASAADAVGDFISGSIRAASDSREAMALNAQVFEENAEAVEDWARNQKDAFSQTDAVTFAATFGNALKSAGMALDDVTDKSKTLTTLAGDLGSTFNASSEEAATALRSGLLGESEPLRRFGVFLSETAVKAKASAMGMEALNGKLTDGQKVAARYQLILEQTADAQGMFGRDTGSLADASKRLESNMEDLKVEVGDFLLPKLVELTDWASEDGVTALRDLIEVATAAGDAFNFFADSGGVWADERKEWSDELEDGIRDFLGWTDAAEDATAATADFQDADRTATVAAAKLAHAAGALSVHFDAVADEAEDARSEIKKLEGAADDALDAFLEAALGPKELRLKLQDAKAELKDQQTELGKLERIKHPTRDQRDDIRDTRLAIIDNKEEVILLTDRLETMGEVPMGSTRTQVNRLLGPLDDVEREAWQAYDALRHVANAAGGSITTGTGSGPKSGRGFASGGLVPAGGSFRVGEKGEEGLVMFPGGGGMVIPGGGGSQPSSAGGSIVNQFYISTPALTPGGAQALADAIAPSITRWQQVRGIVA